MSRAILNAGLFFICVSLLAPLPTLAEDIAQPVGGHPSCSSLEDHDWNKQEKFVWLKVCKGQEVDFNDAALKSDYGGDLDPKDADKWHAERILTAKFIETVLLEDKYRRALTRVGVRITGARFMERLNLENAELRHELWLNKSRLHDGANFSGVRSTRPIRFQGSVVSDEVDDLEEAHPKHDFDLTAVQIDGALSLDGGARFKAIRLTEAVIRGKLALDQSSFGGSFDGEAISAERISAQEKAHFEKSLYLAHATVKTDISLCRDSEFDEEIDLTGAKIDGDLNLGGSTFHGLIDLTGAQISGELSVTGCREEDVLQATWATTATADEPSLELQNAKADRISICDWPPNSHFGGFTYRTINDADGCLGNGHGSMWLEGWFKNLSSPSLQVYDQLATVLQNHGDLTNATTVRYLEREYETENSTLWWKLLRLIFKYVVGYGYRPWLALIFVGILLVVGALFMRISGEDKRNHLPRFAVAYTFDMLLPVIRLRDSHYAIDLKGLTQYYFYMHKIMGYVLASVLIAGLAGLTK
jgi:hypothetical protein